MGPIVRTLTRQYSAKGPEVVTFASELRVAGAPCLLHAHAVQYKLRLNAVSFFRVVAHLRQKKSDK